MFDRFCRLIRVAVVLVLLMGALSACAVGRSVVDIQAPVSTASAPPSGPAVKITDVRDLRQFEVNPRDPSQPSLGDADEIKNPAITSRAIGRKRNGYGMAIGDVALPEGTTVMVLVRGAVQKALQDQGYRVVTEGSPDYPTAAPLTVSITQFWAWFTPGFEVTAQSKSAIIMSGDQLLTTSPAAAEGYARYGTVAVFESTWKDVVERGVADLSTNVAAQIRPAPGAR